MLKKLFIVFQNTLSSYLGAIIFYTSIPLPKHWTFNLQSVARWAPLMGVLIGGFLGIFASILEIVGFSRRTCSVVAIALWLWLTGGLHLDGVIDTADGLAVTDPHRRLAVMQDSVAGAFGVMAAVVVLGLKWVGLSEIESDRTLGMMVAAGWGRWGQVLAIALYPYLKPMGKGAFHKQTIRLPQDVCLGLICLVAVSGVWMVYNRDRWWVGVGTIIAGSAIASGVGFWFNRRLGGQTGDTYGAIVEWTEALLLCVLSSWM